MRLEFRRIVLTCHSHEDDLEEQCSLEQTQPAACPEHSEIDVMKINSRKLIIHSSPHIILPSSVINQCRVSLKHKALIDEILRPFSPSRSFSLR